jgi:hypothetical protein
MDESFSEQSITALFGTKKAFIDKNGDVDMGVIKSVTIDETGIDKVVIKGARQATVSMCQVFENVKDALTAAIGIAEEKKRDLEQNIAAMKGRIQNVINEG